MKIFCAQILFLAMAGFFSCLTTKSYGQCEIKFNHTIINASQGEKNGQIELRFDQAATLPECQLFAYTGNIPYLMTEVTRQSDTSKAKVTFYGLAPGSYTIRMGRKGCKPLFIGEHTKVIVGTNQGR